MGVQAYLVAVEVDMARGLPAFSMVGSLGAEVRESRERVAVALKNAGFSIPPSRITVNLSPADVRKEGTAFDLPIALGILQAMSFFPERAARQTLFLGELGLNGELKRVPGVLPIVRAAAEAGIRQCIVPSANAGEGAVIPHIAVRGAESLSQVLEFLRQGEGGDLLPAAKVDVDALFAGEKECRYDFSQVSGQQTARRAAEIAAAGFHNLLMTGPPGAGKSMIAKRIPGILPPLTLEESLEVTGIHSVAGLLQEGQALVTERPFWNPHHTVSRTALTGGSFHPRPGIVSLSHRGVLFLDELPEFDRSVIDSMRQPLEEHCVQIAKAGGSLTYPAEFMLVCAMNPCPCGYYPDRNRCRCTQVQRNRYAGRVSGPIMDRMDIWVELYPVDIGALQGNGKAESSAQIRRRVEAARRMQEERFAGTGYHFNAEMGPEDVEHYCPLDRPGQKTMERLYQSLQLGARAYHRVRKVARTIADLAGEERIGEEHLLEAAGFRPGGADHGCR